MSQGDANTLDKQHRDTPTSSSEAARKRMLAAKPRDTAPEKALRSALHRLGLRYRVDMAPIPGMRTRADIVFTKAKVAVFVDGCFWHGCPIHGTWPKANAEWWRAKIEANKRRDEEANRRLECLGWSVIRIWEHEDLQIASNRVEQVVRSHRLA